MLAKGFATARDAKRLNKWMKNIVKFAAGKIGKEFLRNRNAGRKGMDKAAVREMKCYSLLDNTMKFLNSKPRSQVEATLWPKMMLRFKELVNIYSDGVLCVHTRDAARTSQTRGNLTVVVERSEDDESSTENNRSLS
eukprot:jgi/Bigna1/91732/estExt_fgenesh1_pg.C_1160002